MIPPCICGHDKHRHATGASVEEPFGCDKCSCGCYSPDPAFMEVRAVERIAHGITDPRGYMGPVRVIDIGTGFATEPDGTQRPLTEEERERFRRVADAQTLASRQI